MQTIEIRTTQNVTIVYELAALRDRIFAFVLDFLLIFVLYVLLLALLSHTIESVIQASGLNEYFVYGLMPVFLFLGYQLSMEILSNGQSIGKKALGIKVVRLDGKEPGINDYVLRAVFQIVDVILSAGAVAALLVGSTANRQRLGDLTAHTTVVRLRSTQQFQLKDILRINSIENYEPQYPEVRRLQEQDMLLVKNTLARYQRYRNAAHRQLVEDLAKKLAGFMQVEVRSTDSVQFLKTLIRDYIVLTR